MKNYMLLLLVTGVISSCRSDKTCKYEKEYNQVSESLGNSLKNDKTNTLAKEELTRDFAKLSCVDFQEKNKLNDDQLKLAVYTMKTTVSIPNAFKSIEENIKLAGENEFEQLLSMEDDGLTEEERNERDSLVKLGLQSTTTEEREKIRKLLKKFPDKYAFKPDQNKPQTGASESDEMNVLMDAFEQKK